MQNVAINILIAKGIIDAIGYPQFKATEDDQDAGTDSRDDAHDHGADNQTRVGVSGTTDTETSSDEKENRTPYSGTD